jgi:hypothetical protein
VRYAHGFGTGSCVFSGFQPCKTANFTVAFPKTEVLGKPLLKRFNCHVESNLWFAVKEVKEVLRENLSFPYFFDLFAVEFFSRACSSSNITDLVNFRSGKSKCRNPAFLASGLFSSYIIMWYTELSSGDARLFYKNYKKRRVKMKLPFSLGEVKISPDGLKKSVASITPPPPYGLLRIIHF